MNKEEIPVFSWNTKTKEFYVLGHKFDGVNSIEDFINYITDLDKENKQLKERLKIIDNYLDNNYTVENQYWFDHIQDIVKDR